MNTYEKLIEILESELEQIIDNSEISFNEMRVIDSLTHSIKSAETICAMRKAQKEYEKDTNPYYRNRAINKDTSTSNVGIIKDIENIKSKVPESFKYKFQNIIDEMSKSY